MRLGVLSKRPIDIREVDDGWLGQIRSWNISHLGLFFRYDPSDLTADDYRRINERLGTNGVHLAQIWSGQPFVSPDNTGYQARMLRLRAELYAAAQLNCPVVIAAGGSYNPDGPWRPHIENESERGVDEIIRRIREFIPVAEEAGVHLAIEPHTLSILRTPERMRRVIDEVGSKWLGCNLDAVNWMNFNNAFHMTSEVNHLFDVLGHRIVSGHAKDGMFEPRLVLHIAETYAGNGLVDYSALVARFAQLDPWKCLVIEHTEDEMVPLAIQHIAANAAKLGIPIE